MNEDKINMKSYTTTSQLHHTEFKIHSPIIHVLRFHRKEIIRTCEQNNYYLKMQQHAYLYL